ncbi:MAG: four helix bundle protein [Candidatus Omnitrophica bacterium]|nr:four helix bundle protein [Candidatus Omnitrophota bacterium]
MKNDLCDRTFVFAKNVIIFLKHLPCKKEADVIRYQLARSATSIGANYEESQAAFSTEDFKFKLSICFKEAKETNYWLRLIQATELVLNNEIQLLIKESEELKNIFGKIVKGLNKGRGKP